MHYNHNVDVYVETFIIYSCGIIEKHAPMKTKKIYQNNVPYMNSELRKLNYQRNMMRNIKNKHPCPENFERYRGILLGIISKVCIARTSSKTDSGLQKKLKLNHSVSTLL